MKTWHIPYLTLWLALLAVTLDLLLSSRPLLAQVTADAWYYEVNGDDGDFFDGSRQEFGPVSCPPCQPKNGCTLQCCECPLRAIEIFDAATGVLTYASREIRFVKSGTTRDSRPHSPPIWDNGRIEPTAAIRRQGAIITEGAPSRCCSENGVPTHRIIASGTFPSPSGSSTSP